MGSIFDVGCAPAKPPEAAAFACPAPRATTDWSRLCTEAFAEFMGTLVFTVFGSLAVDAAYGNGLALAVVVFCTLTVSGGRLNPCVSFAICSVKLVVGDEGTVTTALVHAVTETVVQVAGACAGSALAKAMARGVPCHSCCFDAGPGVPDGIVFAHEMLGTFLLVSTVLAVAVDRTGHEYHQRSQFMVVAPLAVGFALFVAANAAGPYTGGAMNPARVLGSVLTGCPSSAATLSAFVFGEYAGSLVAIAIHLAKDKIRLSYEKDNEALVARYTKESAAATNAAWPTIKLH